MVGEDVLKMSLRKLELAYFYFGIHLEIKLRRRSLPFWKKKWILGF